MQYLATFINLHYFLHSHRPKDYIYNIILVFACECSRPPLDLLLDVFVKIICAVFRIVFVLMSLVYQHAIIIVSL